MSDHIYATTASNTGGTHGSVSLSDGPTFTTGAPLDPTAGLNPEQFLAMSWATCLSASIEAVLARAGVDASVSAPEVAVTVSLHQDSAGGEYEFHPAAQVSIPGLSQADQLSYAAAGHARCPVSKLLSGQGHAIVTVNETSL